MTENGENLPTIFNKILTLYEKSECSQDASNSAEYQTLLKYGAELSEKAIHMVNTINVFSSNEEVEELSSTEIRYLTLPALLAYFTYRKSEGERLDNIKLTEYFYGDFFKLCSNYKIPNIPDGSLLSKGDSNAKATSVDSMNADRSAKIQRYKEQKSLSARLTELRSYVDQEHVDEEVKREYYLKMVQKWAYFAFEELETIAKELPLLEMMKKGIKSDSSAPPAMKHIKTSQRPFILTRNATEARVFGAGYPSLPSYSVEEYCEMQIQQGLLPSASGGGASSAQLLNNNSAAGGSKETEAEEKRAAEEDEKEDRDNEEQLAKRRNWDAFKDDNRRGHGNRMNRL